MRSNFGGGVPETGRYQAYFSLKTYHQLRGVGASFIGDPTGPIRGKGRFTVADAGLRVVALAVAVLLEPLSTDTSDQERARSLQEADERLRQVQARVEALRPACRQARDRERGLRKVCWMESHRSGWEDALQAALTAEQALREAQHAVKEAERARQAAERTADAVDAGIGSDRGRITLALTFDPQFRQIARALEARYELSLRQIVYRASRTPSVQDMVATLQALPAGELAQAFDEVHADLVGQIPPHDRVVPEAPVPVEVVGPEDPFGPWSGLLLPLDEAELA